MYRPFPTSVRVGDAERETAVSALNRHYAEGRLTSVEHGERITWALAAQTSGDLDKLFADLPILDGAAAFADPRGRGPMAAATRVFGNRIPPLPVLLLGVAFVVFVLVHLLSILAIIALVMVVRGTVLRRHFGRQRRDAWRAGQGTGYGSYGRCR
jgi:Flp pilus assembly protein TadB